MTKLLNIDLSERQIKDVIRLATQSAAAAAGMFTLMQYLGLDEKFVGVLSAMLVVQPSVGTTLGAAWERLVASVLGCVVGIVCLIIMPDGYGTAAALGVSMLVMNGIAAFRSEWRYGAVAAVALALGAETNVIDVAIERSLVIGIGVLVGVAVSIVLWPERSSTRTESYLREALRAAADTLRSVVAGVDTDNGEDRKENHRHFLRALSGARDTAQQVRIADNEALLNKIEAVEQFQRGMTVLDRVAEKTDDLFEGNDRLNDLVQNIRDRSCEIIDALTDKDSSGPDQGLDAIRDHLKEMSDTIDKSDIEAESQVKRNAVVFALDEVESSLSQLVELYGQASQPQ